MMTIREKIRPNALILAAMAFAMSVGLMLLLWAGIERQWPLEFMILLATAYGSCLTAMIGLGSQVAADPPPPSVPGHIVERLIDRTLDKIK